MIKMKEMQKNSL